MRLADLEHETINGIVHARLRGEIDMSNAEPLREALNELTPNDALGLILDFTQVEYVDSTGIHLVYRLRQNLRTRGQGFRLVVPSDSLVRDTLRLAGIERSEDVVDSVAAARLALDAGPAPPP